MIASHWRRLRSERGVVSVELIGMVPYMLLAALAIWQILLATWTVSSTTNAARTSSRVEGRGGDGEKAAVDALARPLREFASVELDGEISRVRVRMPLVFPGLTVEDLTVTRSAELPAEP